ncbi:MAG: TetR/AcrR family transcriptional regulator [Gemmatimonadota bacterium]
MRDTILTASIQTIIDYGLNGWTVDEVANKAKCAKGLVNYHYKSKHDLLIRCAETVASYRQARRMSALAGRVGAIAIDRLWAALILDVDEGWFGAWISVMSDNRLRRAAGLRYGVHSGQLAVLAAKALGETAQAIDESLLTATLDGLELALLGEADRASVEEAYHRFWVGLLDR